MATPVQPHQLDPFFAPPEPAGEFHISQWIDVVKRRKWVLGGAWVAVLALFLVQYARTPKAYESSIVVQIERRSTLPIKLEEMFVLDSFWDAQSFYPTQYELLQSRGLAERVVRRLKLAEDPVFDSRGPALRSATEGVPSAAETELTVALAGKLLDNLTIEPVRNTRMVRIAYSAPTPELAARVANGIADAYIDWGIENRIAALGKATEFLATQIEMVKKEMQSAQGRLQAFSQRTDTVAFDAISNATLQRWEELQRQYMAAVSERIGKETVYRAFSPNDQSADAGSAHASFEAAQEREQSLRREADRVKAEVVRLSSAAVEYNNLKLEISTRQALLDDLLRKQGTLDLAGGMRTESNVTIVDAALPAKRPYRPSLPRSLVLGLAIGLALGLGMVALTEVLDRTIKSPEDAERVLGLPILGAVPDVSQTSGRYGYYKYYGYGRKQSHNEAQEAHAREQVAIELVSVSRPRHSAAEAYRSIRTSLLLSSAADLKCVLVTSPVAGEGKTATAGNLAAVLAQLGRRVLLVDADLRKPHQHEILNVSNRAGLVSYLVGQSTFGEARLETAIPGLGVTPSGPIPPNPAELLASERMRAFIAEARERFDFIVLDSPPVIPVTDATILSTYADGVVLCLGAGIVMREEARHCRDRLQLADARILGVLVNRAHDGGRGYKRRYYRRHRSYLEAAPSGAEGGAAS